MALAERGASVMFADRDEDPARQTMALTRYPEKVVFPAPLSSQSAEMLADSRLAAVLHHTRPGSHGKAATAPPGPWSKAG